MKQGVVGQSATSWPDLGPTFIRRVAITTGWVGLIAALCLSVYAGIFPALSFLAGVVLGIADLLLLQGLIREALLAKRKLLIAVYFLMKFLVLYAIGGILLFVLHLAPLYLIIGFSLFLAIVLLKVLGRLLLSSRWMRTERNGAGGPYLRNSPGDRRAGS